MEVQLSVGLQTVTCGVPFLLMLPLKTCKIIAAVLDFQVPTAAATYQLKLHLYYPQKPSHWPCPIEKIECTATKQLGTGTK
jgi:hypothetical protein